MKVCTRDTGASPKKHYSYILVYVDDILCVHEDPDSILAEVDNYFLLKPNSIVELDVYLGAKLKLMQLENGVSVCRLSLSKYVKNAVQNCKKYVSETLLFLTSMWKKSYLTSTS